MSDPGQPPTSMTSPSEVVRYASIGLNIRETKTLTNPSRYIVEMGLGKEAQETFWVITYDAQMRLRTVTEVARGSFSRVSVHLPVLFGAVLLSGADRFMVAHNHPTGLATPKSSWSSRTGRN